KREHGRTQDLALGAALVVMSLSRLDRLVGRRTFASVVGEHAHTELPAMRIAAPGHHDHEAHRKDPGGGPDRESHRKAGGRAQAISHPARLLVPAGWAEEAAEDEREADAVNPRSQGAPFRHRGRRGLDLP